MLVNKSAKMLFNGITLIEILIVFATNSALILKKKDRINYFCGSSQT